MKQIIFAGYIIKTACKLIPNGRFSIECVIEKDIDGIRRSEIFCESNSLSMILIEEAEQQAINFGINIIKFRNVSF